MVPYPRCCQLALLSVHELFVFFIFDVSKKHLSSVPKFIASHFGSFSGCTFPLLITCIILAPAVRPSVASGRGHHQQQHRIDSSSKMVFSVLFCALASCHRVVSATAVSVSQNAYGLIIQVQTWLGGSPPSVNRCAARCMGIL